MVVIIIESTFKNFMFFLILLEDFLKLNYKISANLKKKSSKSRSFKKNNNIVYTYFSVITAQKTRKDIFYLKLEKFPTFFTFLVQ